MQSTFIAFQPSLWVRNFPQGVIFYDSLCIVEIPELILTIKSLSEIDHNIDSFMFCFMLTVHKGWMTRLIVEISSGISMIQSES